MKVTITKAPKLVTAKSGKELIVTDVLTHDGEELAIWSYPDLKEWVLEKVNARCFINVTAA